MRLHALCIKQQPDHPLRQYCTHIMSSIAAPIKTHIVIVNADYNLIAEISELKLHI